MPVRYMQAKYNDGTQEGSQLNTTNQLTVDEGEWREQP